MKKFAFILLGAIVLLVGAFFWLNSYIYNEKQGEAIVPDRLTLSGTYLCLPHKDESVTNTDECAAGLQADSGEYYAIDLGLMAQGVPPLVESDRITASGILTPVEALSTDYWQKYPIIGIFSVTDSLIKEEKQQPENSAALLATPWVWKETVKQSGEVVRPLEEGAFVLTFGSDQNYTSTTDCNSLSGTYAVDAEVLSLASPVMTKMFCEGSLEGEYVEELVLVGSHVIADNELRLNLNRDYGTMVFTAQ